jgi:hypothetical protein
MNAARCSAQFSYLDAIIITPKERIFSSRCQGAVGRLLHPFRRWNREDGFDAAQASQREDLTANKRDGGGLFRQFVFLHLFRTAGAAIEKDLFLSVFCFDCSYAHWITAMRTKLYWFG